MYSFETGNGISAEESGQLDSRPGDETPAIVAQGKYSYTGPDGVVYTVTYVADHDGFHPSGTHLPEPVKA